MGLVIVDAVGGLAVGEAVVVSTGCADWEGRQLGSSDGKITVLHLTPAEKIFGTSSFNTRSVSKRLCSPLLLNLNADGPLPLLDLFPPFCLYDLLLLFGFVLSPLFLDDIFPFIPFLNRFGFFPACLGPVFAFLPLPLLGWSSSHSQLPSHNGKLASLLAHTNSTN